MNHGSSQRSYHGICSKVTLLQHTFGAVYQRGKRKVSLEVDAQNPTGATRLYEKAGMHVERRLDTYEKELRPV